MNSYNSLSIDIIRFEAQDVVTASAASCICWAPNCNANNDGRHRDPGGHIINCPASSHSCNID